MKSILRTVLFLLALLPVAAGAVPFQTTTVEGGQFADDTPWYTMTIGAAHLTIGNPGTASQLALGGSLKEITDDNLWCFVGNETDGYRVYNKAAGPDMVLCAPTAMTGNTGGANEKNGGDSYVVLRTAATAGAAGYTDLWLFSPSTDLSGEDGWYMYEKGYEANKVNNRANVLAFWTAGKDTGSTLVIELGEQRMAVNLNTGSFTSSNASKTYHSTWTSTQENPRLIFSTSKNNINFPDPEDKTVWTLSPASNSNAYMFSASEGYCIAGFGFELCSTDGSTPMVVSCGTASRRVDSDYFEKFAVSGLTEQNAQFLITPVGSPAINVKNIYATVRRSFAPAEPSVELFITQKGQTPYRIPAIAQTKNGNIIAVCDYRPSGADIGSGNEIDLHVRVSKDAGKTWGAYSVIANGVKGTQACAYGDVAMVGDRESDEAVILCVEGPIGFFQGTRENPLHCTRIVSTDGGETWQAPVDITEHIYSQFDGWSRGPIKSMFFGSGRIHQSRYYKVGSHYRLYSAMSCRDKDNVISNFVFYSDDMGKTWKILGSVENPPIPSGADEPKTEELPNGNVAISSRCSGGRNYNIFSYTNVEKGEGRWASQAFSGSSNKGVTALGNACNGELLIVPAVRNKDNKQCYLALQSVPFGNGRTNVGIYYKELSSYANDYVDPATFAKDWDGKHQASSMGSAYSTMIMQQNDTIGFFYEESTYGADYTNIYKPYSIEDITGEAYSYVRPENINATDVPTMLTDELVARADQLTGGGNYVGSVSDESLEAIRAMAHNAKGTVEEVQAFNQALAELKGIELEEGRWYYLRNKLYPALYMSPISSNDFVGSRLTAGNMTQMYAFRKAGDYWKMEIGNTRMFVGATLAKEAHVQQVQPSEAETFEVQSNYAGESAIIGQHPTLPAYPALHMNQGMYIVGWSPEADGSRWYIEPVETFNVTIPELGYIGKKFPFGYELPEGVKAYTIVEIKEFGDTAYASLEEIPSPVPAEMPVLLAGERGTKKLKLCASLPTDVPETLLCGVLPKESIDGSDIYTWYAGGKEAIFRKRNATSGNISANSVYVRHTGDAVAIKLHVGSLVGINDVTTGKDGKAEPAFDLQGRPVTKAAKGILITKDGRKVSVK